MSSKRTCITCTAKKVNKNEIPLWSKKAGLYSMLPKVLTCSDKYDPSKGLRKEIPDITGKRLEAEVTIEESNRWIFYWAAEACDQLDPEKPTDPASSYGDESNRGVVKSDDDGNALFVLNCPKLYKDDEDTLYPRHIHYSVLTNDDVWNEYIETLEIVCKVSYDLMKQIVKQKRYFILNALSPDSFEEQHIPSSLNLHHESMDDLSQKEKEKKIRKVITSNFKEFPLITEFYDKTEDIKQIPIICYCAHEDCDASTKLIDHLYDAGFFNVVEYLSETA